MDEWRTGETQQLMQQVRGELGWVENTPAVAVEGPGNRFIVDWRRLLNEETQCQARSGGQYYGNQDMG